MTRRKRALALPSLLLVLICGGICAAQAEGLVSGISQDIIQITSSYTGTDIVVFGAIEHAQNAQGRDIVVVVRGPDEPMTVRRRDRIAGVWVNSDAARFEGLPVYYYLASTEPIARIAPREALGRLVGIFDAACAAAVVAGAILAPVLITSGSLRASLLVLGGIALLITVLCGVGLRGLDALSAHRADALASRVKVLEGLPVTVGLQQIVLEQLAAAGQFLPDLPPGVDVIVQGMPADSFYAVVAGRVLVHRDGKAVVHLGPGDSFGERGLLDRAPRNATVTTELETTLLRVEGQALLSALDAAPALRPALDLSSTAAGVQVPAGESRLVDDPRWVEV